LEIDEDDMPMDESTTLAAPPVDVGSDDHKALAETPKSTQENPGRITLRLLAPDKLIGRLIGKGGGHIRQIIEETGAHVTVSKDTEIAK
jgi:polyribonucleotide nucleotidyltransferase